MKGRVHLVRCGRAERLGAGNITACRQRIWSKPVYYRTQHRIAVGAYLPRRAVCGALEVIWRWRQTTSLCDTLFCLHYFPAQAWDHPCYAVE